MRSLSTKQSKIRKISRSDVESFKLKPVPIALKGESIKTVSVESGL
jgi:hypothetical protein